MFDESIVVGRPDHRRRRCAVVGDRSWRCSWRVGSPRPLARDRPRRRGGSPRGDYGARVPREGPEEIASLADSFNQMADSLEEQERMRREFIANAAPRAADAADEPQGLPRGAARRRRSRPTRRRSSRCSEEAERLVRLSRSLDTLAAGDAGDRVGAGRRGRPGAGDPRRRRPRAARPRNGRAWRWRSTSPTALPARADPDALAQVLGNLLQNAIRYTPPGGRVDVRAERRPHDVAGQRRRNTGDGIPAADLPHVFERFYRVDKSRDRAHGGAGIGLAIVRPARRGRGRERRRRVVRGPDPLLVQPPGLSADVIVPSPACPMIRPCSSA